MSESCQVIKEERFKRKTLFDQNKYNECLLYRCMAKFLKYVSKKAPSSESVCGDNDDDDDDFSIIFESNTEDKATQTDPLMMCGACLEPSAEPDRKSNEPCPHQTKN